MEISNRRFGLTVGSALTVVAVWPLLFQRSLRLPFLAVALLFAAAAVIYPDILEKPKVVWMGIAGRVAAGVNFLLLATAFFGVVTPVAFFFRLIGRDALGLKFDSKRASYFNVRDNKSPWSFKNPY